MGVDKKGEVPKLYQRIRTLFSSQLLCVLSTYNQEKPYSNLIAFAEMDDLRSMVFVTNRKTSKYTNAIANRNVALLIDSRTNTNVDFSEAIAVTSLGTVEEVAGIDADNLSQTFLSKHPYLENFVRSADSALMRVRVKKLVVSGFNETNVISFDT
jgi:F420-0:gamma-glutamyl ligase